MALPETDLMRCGWWRTLPGLRRTDVEVVALSDLDGQPVVDVSWMTADVATVALRGDMG